MQEPSITPYQFPCSKFVKTTTVPQQLLHITGELWEIVKALLCRDKEHAIEECYDLIHSTETLVRKLVIKARIEDNNIIFPGTVLKEVHIKNGKRGYYECS